MKMEFENLVRENIRELEAYSCARGEFEGAGAVLLDANENPFASGYNRYPDPYQRELKQQVARLKGVDVSRLVLGNGSDELIDMLIRTVCVPGRDNIIVFSPGYSMYEVSARVNGTEVRNLVLDDDFMPEWERIFERVDERTKIIFFCTPNNPVGNVIPLDEIRRVALRFWCRSFESGRRRQDLRRAPARSTYRRNAAERAARTGFPGHRLLWFCGSSLQWGGSLLLQR